MMAPGVLDQLAPEQQGFRLRARAPPTVQRLPPHARLIIHPTTHEVYRIPDEAILLGSQNPVLVPASDFERMLHNGEVAAELLYKKAALFSSHGRGMNGPPSNNNQSNVFRPHEVDVVQLRSTENVPRAVTWATRMEVMLVGTNRAELSYVYDASELGNSYSGGRFLFLWLPAKAAHAFHELKDPADLAIGADYLEPTPDYQPAAGFSGDVQPLGPDDLSGCTRVDPMQLSEAERLFVAMLTPCSMRSVRRPRSDGWREGWNEAVAQKHASFLESQGLRGERIERSVLQGRALPQPPERGRRLVDSLAVSGGLPPAKRMRVLKEISQDVQHVYDVFHNKRVLDDAIVATNRETWSPSMVVKPLVSLSCASWNEDLVAEVFGTADKCVGLDSRLAMKRMLGAQLSRRIWSALPMDLLARIVGHAIAWSLVNDDGKGAAKTYTTMRSLCRGSLVFTDNMVFGQLARLHDEVRQLTCRDDGGRAPDRYGSGRMVATVGPKCFLQQTTATRSEVARPIPFSPALAGARANALGVSCADILRLPLQRAPPVRPVDRGNWPVAERTFSANPNIRGYFKTRIRNDECAIRGGDTQERARFNRVRRDFFRRGKEVRRVLCELRDINPRMHFFDEDQFDAPAETDAALGYWERVERNAVLSMQISPERAIMNDEGIGL